MLQIGPHRGGLVRVLHTGLDDTVGRGGGRSVVDVVVGLRREGTGHLEGGGVALDLDVEVEVSLAGVLVGAAGVRDLAVKLVPALGSADVQLPLALGRDIGLSGTELVGEGDGRSGLPVDRQRAAVPLKGRLDLVRSESQLPVHRLRGAGDVEGPLSQRLRRVVGADVLRDLAAGHRHLGLPTVGIDRHVGRISGRSSHHQCRTVAPQTGEALSNDGVKVGVEGAGNGAVVHHALTDRVFLPLVDDLHRLGQALPVAELLGKPDLEGVPTLGIGVAGVPGELQLEDVIDLDRGVVRLLGTVGVGDHQGQAGDGDRRVVGGSGLHGQDSQERGDERSKCDERTHRTRRSAKRSGNGDGGHSRPFEKNTRLI